MENYVDFFIRKKMKYPKVLLYMMYERVCIQQTVNYEDDALQKMVKYAKKPSEILDIDEYLPSYNAGSHPHLATYQGGLIKKDAKIMKLK